MDHRPSHSPLLLRHPHAELYQVSSQQNTIHYSPNPDQDPRLSRPASSNTCVPSLIPPGMDPAHVDMRTFYPYQPNEIKHRKRTTRPQLTILEDVYRTDTKPNAARRKKLADELGMNPRGVQVWFQNRRAKTKNLMKRKEAESSKDSANTPKSDGDQSDSPDLPPLQSQSAAAQQQSDDVSPETSSPSTSAVPETPESQTTTPHSEFSAVASEASHQALPQIQTSRSSSSPAREWPLITPASAPASAHVSSSFHFPYSPTHLAPPTAPYSSARRPSLPVLTAPAYGAHELSHGFDPAMRRRSCVDPHASRLQAHPYAHLATAANKSLYVAEQYAPPPQRPPLAQRVTVPAPYGFPPHHAQTPTRHPSLGAYDAHSPPGAETPFVRPLAAPIPGPLPAPGFQFGAATHDGPQDGEEEEGSEEHEWDEARGGVTRFGSIVSNLSVGGSESSRTSAFVSEPGSVGTWDDGVGVGMGAGEDRKEDAVDGRRGSCTSGHFLEMFNGLEVNSRPASHAQHPGFDQPGPSMLPAHHAHAMRPDLPREADAAPYGAPMPGPASSSLAYALHDKPAEDTRAQPPAAYGAPSPEVPDLMYPPGPGDYAGGGFGYAGAKAAYGGGLYALGLAADDAYAFEAAAEYGTVLAYGGASAGGPAPHPIYGSGAIELHHMCVPAAFTMEPYASEFAGYS